MAEKKKYSYIKYPYSRAGWFSFVLGILSALMTVAVVIQAVRSSGNTGIFLASIGFSAVVFDIMGIVFSLLSLSEKEKNHLFAWIGGGLSLLSLALWAVIVLV